ncbi:MAG TPA: hypothetical protein ENK52_00985, partial [Saprospiraceae bacterium]|nr:hypothetical protein [Saprospiraceae bacterium]
MNNKYKLLSLIFLIAFLFFAFDSFGPRTDNGPAAANDFVNFETPHVHPIDITPDQQKLLAVNTADNRLEVFQITPTGLSHLGSIPVGMNPVTVRVRSSSEVWVVNHISDNISIVDLNQNIVTKILRTDNEPCDVVFAGSPQKAFVSCSEANTVNVFTLSNLNATPQKIRIIGEEPRAMAVSLDGTQVYVAFFESGNQTTIVPGGKGEGFQGGRAEDAVRHPSGPYGGVDVPPNNGNSFSPPINPALPPPPPVSLIVRKNANNQWLDDNNGDWTPFISGNLASQSHRIPGWDLPDRDVAIMNANNLSTTYQTSLMNIQMAMAVNPNSGQVSVVGSDAINEIRFESNVNGIFARMKWAGFTPGGAKIIKDINPHLTYNVRNIPQSERNKSISDPRGIQWNSTGTKAYVTGMGSNNVIVLNANGDRLFSQPINVGQGPTGIVLQESTNRAFVLNKFDASISILDINTDSELAQIPFYDPTPDVIKNGRPHLYNSHDNSGLGHLACASCHIDARTDGLAWDLGNPDGNMTFAQPGTPVDGAPFNGFHPMKGPFRTSPLTDITHYPSVHWRGDRKDVFDFAAAYETLQSDDAPKVLGEMQQLEAFLSTIHFPPNPYRNLDNSIASSVPIYGPNNTITSFANPLAAVAEFQTACLPCHPGNRGRSDILVENFLHVGTHLVPETFRGFYERSGFWSNTTTGNTSGFGKLPDASEFFNLGQLDISTQRNNEFTALLMSFDGGVPWANEGDRPSLDAHAAVGQQVVVNAGISSQDDQLLNQFLALASNHAVGLIAKGLYQGEYRGFSFIDNQTYQSDKASQIVTHAELMNDALNNGPITFTVVPNNTSTRMGIDRDSDGIFDWDEDNNNTTSPTVNAITITSDDAYELYFNGIRIGTGDIWQTAEHYQNLALRAGENVIAIKGIDQGGAAALIAELRLAGQRSGTNSQWKVNTQLVNNWNQIGFDDNSWSNASDYGVYGLNAYEREVKGMPYDSPASWIWSSDNNNDNTVYLRFTFNANLNQTLEACQGEVVFFDDFTNGLNNWTSTTNASVNNALLTLGQNQLMRSTTGDTWADYTLSADVTIQSGGAGLVFRHIDNNNFYIWKILDNGDLQTSKKQNGLFSILKNIPLGLKTNTVYNISIAAEGNSIRTYINHQLVDLTIDNSFAQGRIGFHQNAGQTAQFGRVQVCLLATVQQDNCNWTEVATENTSFTISGSDLVRFGANGLYFYRMLSGTVDCSNSTFGDPIPGVTKKCWRCQTTGRQDQTISFNVIPNKLTTDA